jgi:hypothetical protein
MKKELTKSQKAVVDLINEGYVLHVWITRGGKVVEAELQNCGQREKVYNKTLEALIRKGVVMPGHDIYVIDPSLKRKTTGEARTPFKTRREYEENS